MWKNSQFFVKKFTITDNHYHFHCEKFHKVSSKFRSTYNYASGKFARHFVKFAQSHTNTKLVSAFMTKKFSICATFCEKIHKLLWNISQRLQMIIIITNCEKIHKLWKFFICENFTKIVKKFTIPIVKKFTNYMNICSYEQLFGCEKFHKVCEKFHNLIWIYAHMNSCSYVKKITIFVKNFTILVKKFTNENENNYHLHKLKISQSLWKISQSLWKNSQA